MPPVLLIMLYNDGRVWTVIQGIAELIRPIPDGLGRYRPQMRHMLLDEGRIGLSDLGGVQNLVPAL
jgi:hypothetical protein